MEKSKRLRKVPLFFITFIFSIVVFFGGVMKRVYGFVMKSIHWNLQTV